MTPGDPSRRRARGRMYGMLFESIEHFLKQDYGIDIWNAVLQDAGLTHVIFIAQKTYPDEWMVNLAKSTQVVTGASSINDIMFYFGTCFVNYCRKFNYDAILRLAGRTYRDFLNEIDNIHETIRFSHPKMQSPSFIVQSEDRCGCVLVYRSMRRGFTYYVIGQLMQCANLFFKVDVEIKVLEEIITDKGCHVTFRLIFDNHAYKPPVSIGSSTCEEYHPVKSGTFFKLFPFCLVFNPKMKITGFGGNLASLLQGYQLLGTSVTDMFFLRRPLVDFTWSNIMSLQRVIFEIALRRVVSKDATATASAPSTTPGTGQQAPSGKGAATGAKRLLLRGQMKYIKDWNAMAFLCTPMLGNLDDMIKAGLYLHDLNMFDNSRDLVMAGNRCASELEYSMEKQTAWTQRIEETVTKLNKARQRSDDLINSMLTKSIADRLKRGDDAVDTCEVFSNVTVLFSYLIGFSDICTGGTPMQVVECVQNVTEVFDQIVDKYNLFKVETLGDGGYMVAGGVPDRCEDHAHKVAGLALELVENAMYVKNPVTGCGMQVQIGMHTGSVVAGIVGKRTPQYCLFGDTVNTAARMQSNGEPGRIHLTQPCHECLKGTGFVSVYRGRIQAKGKGELKAYWLVGQADDPTTLSLCRALQEEYFQQQQRSADPRLDVRRSISGSSNSTFVMTGDLDAEDEKEFEASMCAAIALVEENLGPRRVLENDRSSSNNSHPTCHPASSEQHLVTVSPVLCSNTPNVTSAAKAVNGSKLSRRRSPSPHKTSNNQADSQSSTIKTTATTNISASSSSSITSAKKGYQKKMLLGRRISVGSMAANEPKQNRGAMT